MEEFEREGGIKGVWQQIEDGVGFNVAGHSYGRLDRLSTEELTNLKGYVGAIAQDADRILEGISLMEYEISAAEIEASRSKYAL